jgi:hypothetical protein
MLRYENLKRNSRQFPGLTGLSAKKFKETLSAFERAYQRHCPVDKSLAGKLRQHHAPLHLAARQRPDL